MSAARKIIDKKILRELVPLNTLSQARFEEIVEKIAIQEVREGHYLFRSGDRDAQAVFLLGGEVSLLDRKQGSAGTIVAGAPQSHYPLADAQPRVLSARAAKKCVVARIDSSLLDAFLSWDQANNAEAVAIRADENEDWMTRMLKSQAFEKIPPATIQRLLLKMESIRVAAGTAVVRQGDEGDYFYTIESGRCAVTRRESAAAEDELLAELGSGDCFGEEALVSNARRNATVTMLTDGVLVRLAKEDFVELLQTPLIRHVDFEQAALMVEEGAVWVDVRPACDYDSGALEDSVNIPLASIRGEIPELVFNVSYIICSDSDKRSETAAFILSHRGFDVYVLQGGLPAVTAGKAGGKSGEATPAGTGITPVNPGLEERFKTLRAGKKKLESDLARVLKQQQTVERVVDELKKLHELDKRQLAKSAEEHNRLTAALRDETTRLQGSLAEQAERIEELTVARQAAVETLDSRMQEWLRERTFFKSEQDEAQSRIAELQQRLEQLEQRHDAGSPELREKLEEQLGKTSKKLENKELQCVELRQSQSRLQGELAAMRDARDSLQHRLEKAGDLAASRQQEVEALTAQLEGLAGSAGEQQQALQLQLETVRVQLEDSKRQAVDRQAQFTAMQGELGALKAALASVEQDKQAAVAELDGRMREWDRQRALLASGSEEAQSLRTELEQERQRHAETRAGIRKQLDDMAGQTSREIEARESRCVELEQSRSDLQAQLQAVMQARDALQQELAAVTADAADRQRSIDALELRLVDLSGNADERLKAVRLQLEDLQQHAAEGLAQFESVQQELVSTQAARAALEEEALQLGLQKEELQRAVEQRDAAEAARQEQAGELLRQTNEELARSQDSEQELRGQVDRLRKKLEQTAAELQTLREAERDDIGSIREELHMERSARAAERAEMAARQRELKEQLAAVAAEHEENLANHGNAIEQARLQQMQETRQEAEGRLEELQQELQQARGEIAALEKREKEWHTEQHGLSDALREQYDSTIGELRSRLEQLRQERDAGLQRQHALLEKMKSMRTASGPGPGGAGAEQTQENAALRRQLDEARNEVEVAARLRAEAEAACARLREERDVLQKQVGNNLSLGRPLNPPPAAPRQAVTQPAAAHAAPVITRNAESAPTGLALHLPSGAVSPGRRRVVAVAVVGVVIMAGLFYGMRAYLDTPVAGHAHVQQDTASSAVAPGPDAAGMNTDSVRNSQAAAAAATVVQAPAVTAAPAAPLAAAVQAEQRPQANPPLHQGGGSFKILAAPLPTQAAVEPAAVLPRPQAAGFFRDTMPGEGFAPLMIKLPAATFMMGSKGNSLNFDEGPQHEVNLPRFAISKYEITFADYDRFARANGARLPYDESWGRDDHPAINVSWKDAQAYVRWLSQQTGHRYHLPTEAQWEFAARAGGISSYPWDDEDAGVHANCFDCGSEWDKARTAPVGSFPANHFGLHDMGGNVQEWTGDCYRAGYDGVPVDGSALTVAGCTQRVVRGGSYTSPLYSLRTTSRGQYDEDTRLDNLGFRIVREY